MLYGQYGPKPKPQEKQRRKSTKRIAPIYNILHYAAGGRKPKPQTSGQIQNEWFTSPSPALIDESYKLDMAWVLTRLAPQKLFAVDLLPSQHDVYVKQSMQKVPGWSGYNAILSEKSPMVTAIGYCPLVPEPPTEWGTVYTVMKTVQTMMRSLGQKYSVLTFDEGIYCKAKEIQWRNKDEFQDTVLCLGGFHTTMNFLGLLGKRYDNSGIEDILIESGVYGSNSSSRLLKGKCYNRGVRAHKLTSEALQRQGWQAFGKWMESKHPTQIEERKICTSINRCQDKAGNKDRETLKSGI
jgi:hypothetical protein